MVTCQQCVDNGIADRQIRRFLDEGWWHRVARGVYSVGPPSWLGYAWAGTMLGNQSGVLGLDAAAHLLGLTPHPPDVIHVFVGEDDHVQPRGPWRFVRAERVGMGSPRRTRPSDTVLDVSQRMRPQAVVGLVTDAVSRRLTTPDSLLIALDGRKRHRHRALISDLVAEVGKGAQSPLEIYYLRDVERAHGLPEASRQAHVGTPALTDAWYRQFGTIVELDGRAYHSGSKAFDDMRRDNRHLLNGQVTLRFGWAQVVGDPCEVARQVGEVLMSRGWTGSPVRCAHCLRVA